MDKQEYDAKVAWLRRYRQAVRWQRLLAEDLAECRAEAERITPLLRGGGGTGGSAATPADKLPRAVERILATEAELTAQLARCEAVRQEVLAALGQEQDAQRYELLYRRYVLGQGFGQLAAALHLDARWVRRLHQKSIANLEIDPQKPSKALP